MQVGESGDLQQLKRAKIRYLYLSLPGCPSLSAVGIFPFILPFFLLRDFSLISRWWRSRRGRSRRGSSKSRRGPLCGRLGGAVGIHCRGSRAEWVAASAGQIKAAVSYMIQLQFIMSNEAEEATPQHCRPFDDRILDDYMWQSRVENVHYSASVKNELTVLIKSLGLPLLRARVPALFVACTGSYAYESPLTSGRYIEYTPVFPDLGKYP